MDLCIDSRMISCSGIGTVLKNLIPPLSSPPFSTTLIMHPEEPNREKWLRCYSWKSCKAPIYSIKEQFALPRCVSSCDLFWSPHYNIPLWPIGAKKRIVTIHDACHLAFQNTLGWKERLYAKTMYSQAVSRSDGIITVSKFSQDELHRLLSVPKDRIRVIYPGVDFDRFSREESEEYKKMLRKKYSLPSSFFLFVGNVKPHKNLGLILDAYERNPIDIPFVILGKNKGLRQLDPIQMRIENSRNLQNKIIATGEVLDTELPTFYKMAVSLVFPSLYEGFGLPPIEAMAAGCPVIVSSNASIPEICEDAALFLHSNDPNELGETMLRVSEDALLRQSLREKGRRQARKFSWETTALLYKKLFEEIHFS
jgi:glycosyltransferase involved in cell wall biosynthesis